MKSDHIPVQSDQMDSYQNNQQLAEFHFIYNTSALASVYRENQYNQQCVILNAPHSITNENENQNDYNIFNMNNNKHECCHSMNTELTGENNKVVTPEELSIKFWKDQNNFDRMTQEQVKEYQEMKNLQREKELEMRNEILYENERNSKIDMLLESIFNRSIIIE